MFDNMNEELSVKGRIRAFHQRHGPECYTDGAAFYYADGAWRDVNPLGALVEPPKADTAENEHRLAQLRLNFFQLKLNVAVTEFDNLNTKLAHTIPADPEGELAKLKKLQTVVQARKQEVQTAEAALANTRWGRRRQELLREQQEQSQAMADFSQQRRAIRI